MEKQGREAADKVLSECTPSKMSQSEAAEFLAEVVENLRAAEEAIREEMDE